MGINKTKRMGDTGENGIDLTKKEKLERNGNFAKNPAIAAGYGIYSHHAECGCGSNPLE
jgi:hypothetical protein